MNQANILRPTVLVVFGISGDLSHRYLLPALAKICQKNQLTRNLKILGVSRRDITLDEVFKKDQVNLKSYSQIFKMDLSSGSDYRLLKQKIAELGQNQKSQVIYYLAVPPAAVKEIIRNLGRAGLNDKNAKLLAEKPFGFDLASAERLVDETKQYFDESQVYRIDHYLAKEMVQDAIEFLDKSSEYKKIWNNQFIERVEVTACEEIGIEGRATFYDATGALRDFQSHLLQLAAIILMDHEAGSGGWPQRRLAALRQLRLAPDSQPIRAQYKGYLSEVDDPKSAVETFVSLNLESADPKWQAVPLSLTTGKKLDRKLTQIKIIFKKNAQSPIEELIFRIQPNPAIDVKKSDSQEEVESIKRSQSSSITDAYETVILEAIAAKHNLFLTSDEILASWKILQPVLNIWRSGSRDLKFYEPGATVDQVLNSA